MLSSSLPRPGQLVRVRQRQYLVEDVVADRLDLLDVCPWLAGQVSERPLLVLGERGQGDNDSITPRGTFGLNFGNRSGDFRDGWYVEATAEVTQCLAEVSQHGQVSLL